MMKQRVVLAQALLGDPKIIILDEPTVGLDPKERNNFRKYLKETAKGRIIIYATHVVSDVESIAYSLIIIKIGKILVQGTVDELTKNEINPSDRFSLEDAFLNYVK